MSTMRHLVKPTHSTQLKWLASLLVVTVLVVAPFVQASHDHANDGKCAVCAHTGFTAQPPSTASPLGDLVEVGCVVTRGASCIVAEILRDNSSRAPPIA